MTSLSSSIITSVITHGLLRRISGGNFEDQLAEQGIWRYRDRLVLVNLNLFCIRVVKPTRESFVTI